MDESFIPSHIEGEFILPPELDPIDILVNEIEIERGVEIKERGFRTLTGGNKQSKIPGEIFVKCQNAAIKRVLAPIDNNRHHANGVYREVYKTILSILAKRSAKKRKERKEREKIARKNRKYKRKSNADRQAEAVELSARLTDDRQRQGGIQEMMTLVGGHTDIRPAKRKRGQRKVRLPEQTLVMGEIVDQCAVPDTPDDREYRTLVLYNPVAFQTAIRRHFDAVEEELHKGFA